VLNIGEKKKKAKPNKGLNAKVHHRAFAFAGQDAIECVAWEDPLLFLGIPGYTQHFEQKIRSL
jgi:hypothetical protein